MGAAVFATAVAGVAAVLAYRTYKESTRPKTLLEQVGGEPAVDAAVKLFYQKMLADERVRVFFAFTNMAHQVQRQKNFLLYVLDGGNRHKYHGLSMDKAHARLITQGIKDPQTGKVYKLSDKEFDATAENLKRTFEDLNVPKHLIDTIMGAFESLREQVMCRGKWAAALESAPKTPLDQKTLFERLGGQAAVELVVDKFYSKMLSDKRVSPFFKDTNMAHQRSKQVSFISYVLGSPKKYAGLAMDKAHARLVKKQGLNDEHVTITKEHLINTLAEVGVPKELRDEVEALVESLREQVLCRGKFAACLDEVQ